LLLWKHDEALNFFLVAGIHKDGREGSEGNNCHLFPTVQLNQNSQSSSYQSE